MLFHFEFDSIYVCKGSGACVKSEKKLRKFAGKKDGYETVVMLSQEEEGAALSARVSDKSSSSCKASKKHQNSHLACFVALHTYCFF